jgi:predicted nucleic acid-binding protein
MGYFLKVQGDRKRNAKRILYYLLEIRYKLNTPPLSVDEYLGMLRRSFSRHKIDIGVVSEADKKEIEKLLNSFINFSCDISEYGEALKKLSYDYPKYAYLISLNSYFPRMLTVLENYKSACHRLIQENRKLTVREKEDAVDAANIINHHKIFLDKIDNDIKMISKKCCGWLYYRFSIRNIIKPPKALKEKDTEKKEEYLMDMQYRLDEFIDDVAIPELNKQGYLHQIREGKNEAI